jgi:hypothetical protein
MLTDLITLTAVIWRVGESPVELYRRLLPSQKLSRNAPVWWRERGFLKPGKLKTSVGGSSEGPLLKP